MPRHVLMVLTNPVDGKHDEFNRWYDEVHVPDVLSVDGFVAAQRFKLCEPQIRDERPYDYLAIYEIEGDDVGKALDALQASSGKMDISPTLDSAAAQAWAFSAIGERSTA